MWMFNGYGMGAGGWLLVALCLILVTALLVWAFTRLFPGHGETADAGRARGDDARALLDRRLAAGEIDLDTHQRLRDRLDGHTTANGR